MDLLQLQKQLLNSDTRIIFKKEKSSMKLPNLKLTCKPQNLKKKKKKREKEKEKEKPLCTIPRKSPTNGTSVLTIQEVGSITCQT